MKPKIELICFEPMVPIISGREKQSFTLETGMEKLHNFSGGSQREGEEKTVRYISNTYIFYMLANQIPQAENEEREELEKAQIIILDKIRELYQSELVKEFLKSRYKEEEKAIQEEKERYERENPPCPSAPRKKRIYPPNPPKLRIEDPPDPGESPSGKGKNKGIITGTLNEMSEEKGSSDKWFETPQTE